jgi:polyferredoxin
MKCGRRSCRNLRSGNALLLLLRVALGWTLHQHVIAEVVKGGLGPHRFDPRNPPPTATYLFRYTLVSIAGLL